MKIDGLHLLEGSQITNPVVAHGASFPTGPTNPPDIGELFYLTSGDVGLHYCSATDGTNGTWIKIASSEMDADLVAIASLVGNTGLLKKTAANTWTLDTTAYATQSGLNAVAGAPGKLMVGDEWPLTPEPLQMFYATVAIGAYPKGFYYWDPTPSVLDWVPIEPASVNWDTIYGTPTTIAGYGITDAYTKTETYTQAEVDSAISAATPTFASLTGKPTTLAGYGITDGQPLDGDLSSIAGLSGTSGILTKTATNTWTLDTNTYLTAHPAISGATSANNSGLTYVQDLTFDANGHVTGIQSAAIQSASTVQSGVVQLSDSTSTTNSALGATSTAVKSAYDLAAAALPLAGGSMTGSIVIPTGHHISLTDAPVNGTDAVNKNYVDGNLAGLTWKNSVKAATNGNITLSGTQTVDGVALVAGNRVLVKDQTTASQNGIYVVAAGAWTRATDMDATTPINEVNSAAVFVEGGTVYADTGWTQVNNVSTLNTDPVAFTQFNGASGITAGVGLVKTGNTLDVNLGAGIAQLPTDEVGVDVYATGGLMTTVDGTTSSSLTNAQLSLTKVGTAGTYKSVTTDDFGRVTAGSNPTTLAGYGITDAQALDADLTAIAALAGTSGFLKKTAADTWSLDTNTYATDSSVVHLAGTETITGAKTFSGVMTAFINGTSTSGSEIVEFKGTDYGAGNPYLYIKHSATTANEYFIGLWDGTSAAGTINFSASTLKVSATTASTSSTTGALIVSGGVGIAGDVYVGGDVRVADNNIVSIGNGDDLYLVHDGSNSTIVNQVGHLTLANYTAGGAVLLRAENNSGSNFELWAAAAYLDATTTNIRNQAGSTTFVTIDSSKVQSNVPIMVTGAASGGQFDIVNGSASTWYKSMIRNDGTNWYFLTSGVQTTQANAIAASWNATRPLTINLATGSITLDSTGAAGTSTGGNLTVGGNISIPDNKYLYIGTGNDLYAIHDGANTSIVNQTGQLNITSNNDNLNLIGPSLSSMYLGGEGEVVITTSAFIFNHVTSGGIFSANNTNVIFSVPIEAPSIDTQYGSITSARLITSATTANQVIMTLSSSTYRTVEYLIQATSGTSYHTTKLHLIHNGTDVWINEYGTIFTGTSLATFSADISGGNIRLLLATVANAVTTIKVVATAIDI